MKPKLLKKYQELRRAGYRAKDAYNDAKTILQWEKLEDAGLVELSLEWEEESYFDVYGEPDTEKEREAIINAIERDGCYVVLGKYRLNEDSQWEMGDNVGMCIFSRPLDPADNWYVPDIMRGTINLLRDELKSRCVTCRQPVQV